MEWGETLDLLDRNTTVMEAVARWGGDPDTVKEVSNGVNVVFRFTAKGEGRFIRFTHTSLLSERRVGSALDYLRHLETKAAQVCTPIISLVRNLIETFAHEDGKWLATVTAEVPGAQIGLDDTDPGVYEAWGRALGTIHLAAESYRPAPHWEFEDWNDIWGRVREGISPWDTAGQAEFERLDSWYRSLPAQENDPDYGITHADCNPNNVLWDGRQAVFIDFDEPSWGWFAGDIARALLLDFSDRPRERKALIRTALLRGYRSARDFSAFWEAQLDGFVQMRLLDMYAMHTFANLDELEQNGFCQRLRERFKNPSLWGSL